MSQESRATAVQALIDQWRESADHLTSSMPLPSTQQDIFRLRYCADDLAALLLREGPPQETKAEAFINRLRMGDSIVCSDGATEVEIAMSQACGRWFQIGSLGYIYRPRRERLRCQVLKQDGDDESPHQCVKPLGHDDTHSFDALMVANGPIRTMWPRPLRLDVPPDGWEPAMGPRGPITEWRDGQERDFELLAAGDDESGCNCAWHQDYRAGLREGQEPPARLQPDDYVVIKDAVNNYLGYDVTTLEQQERIAEWSAGLREGPPAPQEEHNRVKFSQTTWTPR